MKNKSSQRMPVAIWALSIGAFGIGTTEFVVMGLLIDIARDLKISISEAGYIVTAYAFGVVIGAPLLSSFLSRAPRRVSLIGLMTLFSLANLVCAFATSFTMIVFARIVTAFAHASYFGIGSVVAAEIAPPSKRSRAISGMFLGATIANVIGVPGGAFIGHTFGWRATFLVVALLGIFATLATIIFVPRTLKPADSSNFQRELLVLRHPQVLASFVVTAFGFGGTFTAFTYIAPMLTFVTRVQERFVAPILLLFGLGMIFGNSIGGRLADRGALTAVRTTLLMLGAALLLMSLSIHNLYSALFAVFLLGLAMFATISPLQSSVIELAREAPALAASCNIAAFNFGNAMGAYLGGYLIDSGAALGIIPIAGALVTFLGFMFSFLVTPRQPDVASSAR